VLSRHVRTLLASLVVLAGVLGLAARAYAAPGPYFPPNPSPQYAEPGLLAMGDFPVPGLYLGFGEPGSGTEDVECELKVSDDFGAPEGFPADPVASPPSGMNGELDSYLQWGVKSYDPDNLFVGIATATYGIFCKNPDSGEIVGHTYTLALYVGVPIPAAGGDTGWHLRLAAATMTAGVGLVAVSALSRRRRLAV
jgi:hypothetical protein